MKRPLTLAITALLGVTASADFPTGHFVGRLQTSAHSSTFSEFFVERKIDTAQYLVLGFFAPDPETPPVAGGAFLGEEIRPGTLLLKRVYPSPNWPTFQVTEEHRLTLSYQPVRIRGGALLDQIEVTSRPHTSSWIVERPQDGRASALLPFGRSLRFNGTLRVPSSYVDAEHAYQTRATLNETRAERTLALRYGAPIATSGENAPLVEHLRDLMSPYEDMRPEQLRLSLLTPFVMSAHAIASDALSPSGIRLGASPYGLVVAVRASSFGRRSLTLRGAVQNGTQIRIITFPYELMLNLSRYPNLTEAGLEQHKTDANWSHVIVFEE